MQVERAVTHNTVEGREGPQGAAKNVETALQAWELFASDDILQDVVTNTNIKIAQFRENFEETLYLRGARYLNGTKTRELFYHESSLDIFQATMSYNRFSFLIRFLEFDDKETRQEIWLADKYSAFREFFEKINENNAKMSSLSVLTKHCTHTEAKLE